MLTRLYQWSQLAWARLPALLPSSCALCGMSNAHPVCDPCRRQFFHRRAQSCSQCAMPLADLGIAEPVTHCGACLDQPPAYDATLAAVDYGAPIDQLVISLKFGGKLAMAPIFAQTMRDALLAGGATSLPSLLLPVPLGAGRLRQRGYNQALEIARPLSRALGIRLEPRLLIRSRDTGAQSSLHPEQRRKNVRNAFTVAHGFVDRLHGLHIGIVDDVMTTGETLNELAATAKCFGASRVTNFVFARTLLK